MAGFAIPLALAGAGALASGIGSALGKSAKIKKNQLYTPEQQGVLNQQLQMGQQNANPLGLEQRARQQFQTQTIPSIAERFARMGQNRGSSGLVGQLGAAGSDLESQLAALRSQYGQQQLQLGLRPQFENYLQPGGHTFASGALSGLGQGLSGAGMSGLQGNMIGSGAQQDNRLQGLMEQLNSFKSARNKEAQQYQDLIAELRTQQAMPQATSLSPLSTQQGPYNVQSQLLRGLI